MRALICFFAVVILTLGNVLGSGADMVGQEMPRLVGISFLGDKPDYEGKPLLLEFWATWCPPCRDSIPHINKLYGKFKERGLVVIGVTDESRADIRKFQKKIPMDYAVGMDNSGQFTKKFGIKGIPHALLVNKEGVIVWQGHPATLTEADIEKILE